MSDTSVGLQGRAGVHGNGHLSSPRAGPVPNLGPPMYLKALLNIIVPASTLYAIGYRQRNHVVFESVVACRVIRHWIDTAGVHMEVDGEDNQSVRPLSFGQRALHKLIAHAACMQVCLIRMHNRVIAHALCMQL